MKTSSDIKREAREVMQGNMGILIGAFMATAAILYALTMMCYMIIMMNIGMDNLASVVTMNDLNVILDEIVSALSTPSMLALQYVISIIMSLLTALIMTGYRRVCLVTARREKAQISDLFYTFKNNPDKVIVIALIVWLASELMEIPQRLMSRFTEAEAFSVAAALSILACFALLLLVGILIILIKIWLFPSFYLYLDDSKAEIPDLLKNSKRLMKGNVLRFISLCLSFVGWIIVGMFTFGIGYIFIIPYMYVSFAVFYRNLEGEKDGHCIEA